MARSCRHTKRHGVFAVGLAAGLKEHGLHVSFHSDPDFDVGGFEKRCYARARHVGIVPEPALELSALLRECRRGRIPIVLFNTPSNLGYFSPLLGIEEGELQLPLVDGGRMPKDDFLQRWSEPGILRQCVVADLVRSDKAEEDNIQDLCENVIERDASAKELGAGK